MFLTTKGDLVIRGLLLDLDGTLLDIDIDPFLGAYFRALGPLLSSVVGDGSTPESALQALLAATDAMCRDHSDRTNREVFDETFASLTGARLTEPSAAAAIDAFYQEVFPTLRGTLTNRPGADAVVKTARDLGLTVVVATNPIFPLAAIGERLAWAGFSVDEFDLVTSYETMRACKPSTVYYRQISDTIGIAPSECLMVGDDASLDMPAADIGMKTFYVGNGPAPVSDWAGDLHDLAELLERIAAS